MKRISKNDLTSIEKERYDSCTKQFNTEGFLYYVTESCPGCGYEIFYSQKELKDYNDLKTRLNTLDVLNITDINAAAENI